MAKITKQEFENWSKDFGEKVRDYIYLISSNGDITEEETNQMLEVKILIEFHIKNENPLAVACFLSFFADFCPDENKVYPGMEDLTAKQWVEKYQRRLKEHAAAGGYYNPSKTVDLSSLTERWKKLLDLAESEEQKEKIGQFMSSEDYQIVSKAAIFMESLREIAGEEKGDHKNKKNVPLVNNYPFLIEDLCGRVEAAQKKLEQAERERERETIPTIVPLSLTLRSELIV